MKFTFLLRRVTQSEGAPVFQGRKRLVAVTGLALALAVGLSACGGGSSDSADGPPKGGAQGQLVIANAEPATAAYWDPASAFGLVDDQVGSLVYDTLLKMDGDGKLQPSLATKWERASDTELTLTLRTDAKFHDGTDVTAEDVAASLNRLMEPDSKLAKTMLVTAGKATASGDTVTVTTERPYGPLENSLAELAIVSKKDSDNPDNFKKGANGSGPYKFVSYKGDDITLEANNDYWGGAPHIKTVILRYIADADARQNALLSGQADIATRVGPTYVDGVKGNDKFRVETVSPPSQVVVLYQHNGPLADVKIRQALAYAIDRESIAKNLMKGVNPVGFNSLPTSFPSYQDAEQKFAFDPDTAKKLLADAGAADLKLTMATSTLVPNQIEIDQAIAQNLKAVGVTVDVKRLEVGEFRTTYNKYDLSMNTLASFNNDPGFILGYYKGALGEAVFNLKDPKADALVDKQGATVGDARDEAINEAATYLWDNQMALYLSDETWSTIVSARVKDYERVPLVGEPMLSKAYVN
jgi:peptide/nickel transport system substrate-binding protein